MSTHILASGTVSLPRQASLRSAFHTAIGFLMLHLLFGVIVGPCTATGRVSVE